MIGSHVSLKFLLVAVQKPRVNSRFCLWILWGVWPMQEVLERNVFSFLYDQITTKSLLQNLAGNIGRINYYAKQLMNKDKKIFGSPFILKVF